jgi:hypothetical protein
MECEARASSVMTNSGVDPDKCGERKLIDSIAHQGHRSGAIARWIPVSDQQGRGPCQEPLHVPQVESWISGAECFSVR